MFYFLPFVVNEVLYFLLYIKHLKACFTDKMVFIKLTTVVTVSFQKKTKCLVTSTITLKKFISTLGLSTCELFSFLLHIMLLIWEK